MDDRLLKIGHVLSGTFEIRRVLLHSRSAAVYQAFDVKLRREVCVKVLFLGKKDESTREQVKQAQLAIPKGKAKAKAKETDKLKPADQEYLEPAQAFPLTKEQREKKERHTRAALVMDHANLGAG